MAFGIKTLADDRGSQMNAGYLRMAVALWFVALVAGGYAESFPNRPTAGEQSEYVVQGIICGKAVREREEAVNRSQNFLPYCGNWLTYIISLQQELETLAPMYVDHENGPLTDAEDAFLYFTLDNWRATAGLNASGFRRSTDGTTFFYGKMQPGDIIGPWIFEDLQNGFSALEYTLKAGTLDGMRKTGGANGGDQPPYDEEDPTGNTRGNLVYMEALSDYVYAGCTPYASSTFEIYSRIFRYEEYWYDTTLSRINGDLSVTGIPVIPGVTHTWELYLIAESHDNWIPYGGTDCVWIFDTLGDFTYSPADGVLSRVEEDNSASSDTFHDVGFGSLDQPCPWIGNPAIGIVAFQGYTAREISFLLRWYFTNANP